MSEAAGKRPGPAENLPLTAIRGVAALWVVGHHWLGSLLPSSRFLSFGYTAVDLFFVLSGMIIASVYAGLRWRGTGRFLLKRACRIYPLHVVTLTALIIVGNWPVLGWPFLESLPPWRLAGSFALLQPYVNLATAGNPPAWSAGVELSCYLAFPLAIVLLRRVDRRLAAACLAAAAAAGEYAVVHRFAGDTSGTGAILRGLCGFALGMTLWRLGGLVAWRPAAAGAAELAGLGGIAWAIAANRADLVPLGAALLLFGLGRDRGPVAWLLRAPFWVFMGRISFSIYLVHYPMLVAADRWLPASLFPGGAQLAGVMRVAVLAPVLVGVCAVTYRLVEQPGRRLPERLLGTGRRRRVALAAPAQ